MGKPEIVWSLIPLTSACRWVVSITRTSLPARPPLGTAINEGCSGTSFGNGLCGAINNVVGVDGQERYAIDDNCLLGFCRDKWWKSCFFLVDGSIGPTFTTIVSCCKDRLDVYTGRRITLGNVRKDRVILRIVRTGDVGVVLKINILIVIQQIHGVFCVVGAHLDSPFGCGRIAPGARYGHVMVFDHLLKLGWKFVPYFRRYRCSC